MCILNRSKQVISSPYYIPLHYDGKHIYFGVCMSHITGQKNVYIRSQSLQNPFNLYLYYGAKIYTCDQRNVFDSGYLVIYQEKIVAVGEWDANDLQKQQQIKQSIEQSIEVNLSSNSLQNTDNETQSITTQSITTQFVVG